MLTSGQDPTPDIAQDNYYESVGFLSTNAEDMPLNVEQSTTGEREREREREKERERKYLGISYLTNLEIAFLVYVATFLGQVVKSTIHIQSLCSTIDVKSTPLLYPEATIFIRHFYLTSKVDGQSILGARPLFCLTSKMHPSGQFESALIHICTYENYRCKLINKYCH